LALGISVLGIYGVVTYFVSQRTREFGVRLALGATPRNVLKMVLDYTIHVMLVGLLPAVFIASVSTRLLEHNLMNLMPNSIAAWVQTPIAMLVTGIAAGLIPARRAARVDPNVALREL
jgi:ABC-type antimicrobial peptide transport system permease subunit